VSEIGLEAQPLERELDDIPATGVRRGAAETVLFRGVGLPLSFAISVITSRYLEPAGRGAYVLGLLTVTITATLLGNISAGVTHEIGERSEERRTIVTQAIVVAMGFGVVGAAVLLPLDLRLAQHGYHRVAFAAVALPALLVTQAISGALLALGRLRQWNALQLVLPAATLLSMLVFVVGIGRATTGAVTSWALAQGVVAVMALYLARDLWLPFPVDLGSFRYVRPIVSLGLRIGVVNVVSLVNYRVELIILEAYQGLNSVGIYSLAVSLGELLWILSASLSAAAIARAVHADDRTAAEVIARGVRHSLILTAVCGALLLAAGWFLIPVVFGEAFASSRGPLLILVPGLVAFAPGSVLAVYFSLRIGRARYALVLAATSAVVTAALAVLLIPDHGITGAALASTAGYTVSIVAALLWFLRIARLPAASLVPRLADLAAYRPFVLAILRR
jgi:O-antigen/teichoic acid export membrane protein